MIGGDGAGTNRVDAHVMLGELNGQRFDEHNLSGFGARIRDAFALEGACAVDARSHHIAPPRSFRCG